MKKLWNLIRRSGFLLLLVLVLVVSEVALNRADPMKDMTSIWRNDYELIQLQHPDMTFSRAFYGSSVATASFIEERSDSGYVNLGMDYGTIRDLMEMLDKGLLTVTDELVLALNDHAMLDTLDTNATYPWHRKWYEPYLYFHRDRLRDLVERGTNNLLRGDPFIAVRFEGQEREIYHGILPDEKLLDHEKRIIELFGDMTVEDCKENFAALDRLAEYCRERGIRLRAVWMPWNTKVEVYPAAKVVIAEANRRMEALDIEVLDLTYAAPDGCMHDTGHLNYEYGAPWFTDLITPWLKEGSK